MKTKKHFKIVFAVVGLITMCIEGYAQWGTQMRSPSNSTRYFRLRSFPNPNLISNTMLKAAGIYQSDFIPSSMLEVNTTSAYTPFPHPNFAAGEVFSTDCPAGHPK